MAKRLYMTSADYVAIAVSPALIMALVGSLVYFLIEVLYVGEYQARLNYAFGLFVFAAVLIARISIEMGSERAAAFALPLGIAMFLFLLRFVEHPNALSPLINLGLLALVWWCAHQLTWDSTVIDDDQDASGEGLMQRIGVDELQGIDGDKTNSAAAGASDNELLADSADSARRPWWKRLLQRKGPHTPGLWVLYFSLAALPLFGIGQHWIPVAEAGRRRYAFGLLLVYVAAALALLVTTSFLNLRRYLRQRHVEMPLPIAGTWVGVGAVLIAVVMFLAALLPRPSAEIALSRVPWQAGSPGGLRASQRSVHRDGGEEQESESATAGDRTVLDDQGQQVQQSEESANSGGESTDSENGQGAKSEGKESGSSDSAESNASESRESDGAPSDSKSSDGMENGSGAEQKSNSGASSQKGDSSEPRGQPGESNPSNTQAENSQGSDSANNEESKAANAQQENSVQSPAMRHSAPVVETLQGVSSAIGGLAGALKLIFYVIVALILAFLVVKYRQQILRALADIMQAIRNLFGGKPSGSAAGEASTTSPQAKRLSFKDFRDPFATGEHGRLPPEELVRYTFAAFEAWASDRGRGRTPDCTPSELVGLVLEPDMPMHDMAKRLARKYGEVAYASRRIPRESSDELRNFWQLMRSTHERKTADS